MIDFDNKKKISTKANETLKHIFECNDDTFRQYEIISKEIDDLDVAKEIIKKLLVRKA